MYLRHWLPAETLASSAILLLENCNSYFSVARSVVVGGVYLITLVNLETQNFHIAFNFGVAASGVECGGVSVNVAPLVPCCKLFFSAQTPVSRMVQFDLLVNDLHAPKWPSHKLLPWRPHVQ